MPLLKDTKLLQMAMGLALACPAACGWSEEEKSAVSPGKIAAWIKQLGSEDFNTREEAKHHLLKAGPAAIEAMKAEAKNPDVEVRENIRTILTELVDKPLCAQLKIIYNGYLWRGPPAGKTALLTEKEWVEISARLKKDIQESIDKVHQDLKEKAANPDKGADKNFLENFLAAKEKALKVLNEQRVDFTKESVVILVDTGYINPKLIKLEPENAKWTLHFSNLVSGGKGGADAVVVLFPKTEKPVKFEMKYEPFDLP